MLHYSIPNVQQFGSGVVEPSANIDSAKTSIERPLLLVSKLNPRKGTIALARPHEALTTLASGEFVAMEPKACMLEFARYFYLSEHVRLELSARVDSATRSHQRCSPDDISKMPISWPPMPEQGVIATFLDRETAKIDALVAKKERLIELLQEKRTALTTRAVTRGLDPSVPTKASGVAWLGEIPTHWDVKRVKWVAQMESGHTPDKKVDAYWNNVDIPWVSLNDTGHLKDHDFISDTEYSTNALGLENSSARLLPARSVVFSRDATIGLCAIIERPMAVSQHFIAWICGRDVVPEYLLRVFDAMQGELQRLTMGATIRTIGMPDVKTLATPVPPLDEQKTILKHIQQKCLRIDGLLSKVRRAINLLTEYRTALISATVTGKIDVRKQAA